MSMNQTPGIRESTHRILRQEECREIQCDECSDRTGSCSGL